MNSAPYAPLPSTELPENIGRHLAIRPVFIRAVAPDGNGFELESDSSAVVFAFLANVARSGSSVESFHQGGRPMDRLSLAILNCYLRTGRTMGDRMKLPFDRLPVSGTHRYAWATFCEHLGLSFQ